MQVANVFVFFLIVLVLLVFVVLLIGLVVWAVTRSRRNGPAGSDRSATLHEDPLDTLHNRYARGEISREEYLAMKEDLES